MEPEQPEVFVLGGPNGAGKTTVAELLIPDALGVQDFVNADFIAKGLSPHAPEEPAFEAGRIMLRRIRELRERRRTFGFETTLASRTFAPFLRQAQRAGYIVHIVYVCLDHPDLAVDRIGLRVQEGGHDIPESVVRRRFTRSLRNFFQLYRPLADGWSLWDNSRAALVPLARGRAGAEVTVLDPGGWGRMLRLGTSDAR